MRTKSMLLIATIALGLAAPARAFDHPAPDPIPAIDGPILGPIARPHVITLAGKPLPYHSIWQEYPLLDKAGKPQATISATAYVRDKIKAVDKRPVMFLFNGGPGASSSPLHGGFAPRTLVRAPRPEAGAPPVPPTIVDNPDTLLDVADLVFIDPVATGFSRVLPGGDGSAYWAIEGDAQAALTLVRTWLRDHDRAGSPVIIVGESYGGFRLAEMMKDAGDLNLTRLVMVSPALDMSDLVGGQSYDMGYVQALPSMAAIAWYHQKVDQRGLDVDHYFAEAEAFATHDYLAALYRGSALPEADKRAIAQRMAGFIGLPADTILKADLRINTDLFVTALTAADKQVLTRLDGRRTMPVRPPSREGRSLAASELGLGHGNANISPDMARYMRDEIGFPAGRDYVSLTLDVNYHWNWREEADDASHFYAPGFYVAKAMAAKPQLRLMVLGGMYDLAVPIDSVRYALQHANVPQDRVDYLALHAGHTAFADDKPAITAKLRAFVESAAAQ